MKFWCVCLEKSRERNLKEVYKEQQGIDPVDLVDKAFLATLEERYHLDALKQIKDSKLFQGKA